MADNLTGTQGHETEAINVQGLKSTLQKMKTEMLDGKAEKTTTVNGHALSGNVTVSKSDVGLGSVTNDAQVKRSEMGAANGVAELDANGLVPSSQLPSYVDDVLEYDSKSAFPVTGETGKIYVDKSDNTTWRWSGSAYSQIKGDLALGETSSTAYRGDRGKIAYDHSQTTSGNPHNVTKADVGLGNVDNTADANKSVNYANSAGSATNAINATNAGNADTVDGLHAQKLMTKNDNVNDYKNTAGQRIIPIGGDTDIISGTTVWGSALQWSNTEASPSENGSWLNQLFGLTNDHLYFRTRTNGGNWTSLHQLAYTSDLGNYLPLSGGTMNGQLTARTVGTDTFGGGIQLIEYGDVGDTQSAWEYSPSVTFHWRGICAGRLGIRSDGQLAYNNQPLIHSGNIGSQSVNYANTAGTATDPTKLPLSGGTMSGKISNYGKRILQWTDSDQDNNPWGASWYGIGRYDIQWPEVGQVGMLSVSNYWGINLIANSDDRVMVNDHPVITTANIGSQSVSNADTVDGYHENAFLRYRAATSTNGESSYWNQIGIKQYNNALPDGLTDHRAYTWGAVISIPTDNARFDIYANHHSSTSSNLYYRTGWDGDKHAWAMFIDSHNIGSQSVNYANSAGTAGALSGVQFLSGNMSVQQYTDDQGQTRYCSVLSMSQEDARKVISFQYMVTNAGGGYDDNGGCLYYNKNGAGYATDRTQGSIRIVNCWFHLWGANPPGTVTYRILKFT